MAQSATVCEQSDATGIARKSCRLQWTTAHACDVVIRQREPLGSGKSEVIRDIASEIVVGYIKLLHGCRSPTSFCKTKSANLASLAQRLLQCMQQV